MPGWLLPFGSFVMREAERNAARAVFLEVVAEVAPDVLTTLRESAGVEVWIKGWPYLDAQWVRTEAQRTLDWWGQEPPGPGRLRWRGLLVNSRAPAGPSGRFVFECQGYDPGWSTRAAAETTIRADFERQLREHLDQEEACAAADGFKRLKSFRELRRHMDWLARYQVLEHSYGRISKDTHGGSPKSIKDDVRAMCALLELPPRPSRRGSQPRRFPS